jgi:hypothetical protein
MPNFRQRTVLPRICAIGASNRMVSRVVGGGLINVTSLVDDDRSIVAADVGAPRPVIDARGVDHQRRCASNTEPLCAIFPGRRAAGMATAARASRFRQNVLIITTREL